MLKLVNVKKDYVTSASKVEALKGINLEFRKNEFVSILGPSGCGKTTLLNIIGGLDRYTSGDLFINNKSTKDFADREWDAYRNHSIGFVFQNYNLIPHLSVLSNVELAMTLSGVSKAERREKAIMALASVGIEDQKDKKPNQLSGGQMQRVAIARALVNNPDILLADEPTGALDTETSKQIMNILKEISKERLIIMVTHNPELAKQYSTRVINLLDGLVINDTNPYQSKDKEIKAIKLKTKLTSMNFFTALSLSLKNLTTKKVRTFLTAFAGSIGIIGIALVLALASGFQGYVDTMQADTLTAYPITISTSSINFNNLPRRNLSEDGHKQYPIEEKVYINKIMEKMQSMMVKNNITQEYLDNAINTIDKNLINGISYTYDFNLNLYKEITVETTTSYKKIQTSSSGGIQSTLSNSGWKEILDNRRFIESQYDVFGSYPTEKNQIVLVVDSYNRITDSALNSLGISYKDIDSFTFDQLIGTTYRLMLNNEYYQQVDGKFERLANSISKEQYEKGLELEIVAIMRPKEGIEFGSISGSIGYLKELTDYVRVDSLASTVVLAQKAHKNDLIDVFTNTPFEPTTTQSKEDLYNARIHALGAAELPSSINIYPVDFASKEKIKKHLDDYNAKVAKEDKVYYSDIVETLIGSINTVINAISYILIAFTSVSLVVSSIMIGIITYISVLERTREIGVLRSIGARKKDISRVFNAETLIIGFFAGLIGVVFTVIVSIPINMILVRLINVNNIASLQPLHGIILIVISMCLTLIAGLIPSRIAAKKDPVIALRSE